MKNEGNDAKQKEQPDLNRKNPFEEEQQGNEQPRIAPGAEREYQGDEPEQRRAPGHGKDDPTEDSEREIA